MAFKLQQLVKKYSTIDSEFDNKQLLLADLCTTIEASQEWDASYVGNMAGIEDSPAQSSTDHAGVAIQFGSSLEEYCLVQGFTHKTSGAKLLFILNGTGTLPFDNSLYLNSSLNPCGLSLVYIPPFKSVSWPTTLTASSWGVSEGLKIISLANSKITLDQNVISFIPGGSTYPYTKGTLIDDGYTVATSAYGICLGWDPSNDPTDNPWYVAPV